jgi:tetratricopeptide (TPR) repeat protein
MAKTILALLTAVLLHVLVGCTEPDSGLSQLTPPAVKNMPAVTAQAASAYGETDLVERLSEARTSYEAALMTLAEHYAAAGNNMKLAWASSELDALGEMPRYNYIIEAAVAGPDLRASQSIPLADYMYADAVRAERRARLIPLVPDDDRLRAALEQYNELIRQHPTSDKIDDAAYRAAGIYETFKDYTIAVMYYQRVYQWDPQTLHPARYRQAAILDRHLHRRAEALELYTAAIGAGNLSASQKKSAEQRIKELTEPEGGLESVE